MKLLLTILFFISLSAKGQEMMFAAHNQMPVSSFLLDSYGTSVIRAYSLRKLKTGVTVAIRVRRSTDAAETDIGFDGNGSLDTVALKSFCGAALGSIVTWYDQSGGGFDLSYGGGTMLIFDGTHIYYLNGKPSINFSNAFLVQSSTTAVQITPSTAISVSSRAASENTIRTIFGWGVFAGGQNGMGQAYADATNFGAQDKIASSIRLLSGTATFVVNTTAPAINTASLQFSIYTASTMNQYINGSLDGSTSFGSSTTSTNIKLAVGARMNSDNLTAAFFHNGDISEVIIWQADKGSDRSGMESNINSYYTIY